MAIWTCVSSFFFRSCSSFFYPIALVSWVFISSQGNSFYFISIHAIQPICIECELWCANWNGTLWYDKSILRLTYKLNPSSYLFSQNQLIDWLHCLGDFRVHFETVFLLKSLIFSWLLISLRWIWAKFQSIHAGCSTFCTHG